MEKNSNNNEKNTMSAKTKQMKFQAVKAAMKAKTTGTSAPKEIKIKKSLL